MRAMGVTDFGGPEKLEMLDVPVPEPGPGEVRVAVATAGLNFIDIYMRSGAYRRSDTYKTPLPMILGMEGMGRIDALGEGVEGLSAGDRVAWCIHRGAYAEYAILPAWKLVPVPDEVPDDIACALQLQGCTAHYLSHSAFPLRPGHTCLIHAGAGGVGQLLIQLAKSCGARVLTTVGSPEKAEIARARGADEVILYREIDFASEVRRLTDGRGVDVAYDAVGRDTIAGTLASLARRGSCINYGGASGLVEAISPLDLAEAGSVFFTRPHLADYMQNAEEIRSRTDRLFTLWASGELKVVIDRTFPLAETSRAHELIESGGTRGKVLIAVA